LLVVILHEPSEHIVTVLLFKVPLAGEAPACLVHLGDLGLFSLHEGEFVHVPLLDSLLVLCIQFLTVLLELGLVVLSLKEAIDRAMQGLHRLLLLLVVL
jgi:hypothetical protein